MSLFRRGPRKWTPEMDRELCNMWDYGIHRTEIAKRMDTTVAAVEGRYYKLKKLKGQADAQAVAAE
jgi:hypothetical protein